MTYRCFVPTGTFIGEVVVAGVFLWVCGTVARGAESTSDWALAGGAGLVATIALVGALARLWLGGALRTGPLEARDIELTKESVEWIGAVRLYRAEGVQIDAERLRVALGNEQLVFALGRKTAADKEPGLCLAVRGSAVPPLLLRSRHQWGKKQVLRADPGDYAVGVGFVKASASPCRLRLRWAKTLVVKNLVLNKGRRKSGT